MESKRLALMIDGENAQASLLPQILNAASQYGTVTIRRVYGDWSKPQMASWREVAHTYALETPHQFHYASGKNATDMALIIDAMEIFHTQNVTGFCIVSSDSDYTPLVMYLRQKNRFVIGVGRQNTSQGFVKACNKFFFTDNKEAVVKDGEPKIVVATKLQPAVTVPELKNPAAKPAAPKESTLLKPDVDTTGLKMLFQKAFELVPQKDNGWVLLAAIGKYLRDADSSFDHHNYGHSQLLKLFQAHPKLVELRKVKNADGNEVHEIRLKSSTKKAN